MAATITFTDSVGAATLTALGGRLNNWTPDGIPVDDFAERLGSGAVDTFELRDRGGMTFEVSIENTQLDTALRLQKHLWRGGTCTVNTGDLSSPSSLSYADMGILMRDGQRVPVQISRAFADTVDYLVVVAVEYKGTGTIPRPIALY